MYWKEISRIYAKQKVKGLAKYGTSLEENDTLTIQQRIEHTEEELVDALCYLEHLKAADLSGDYGANDYQRAARRTANMNYDTLPMLANAVMGLNGEAGEVIDIAKKHYFQGHELNREKMVEELGDCLWYIALACTALDTSLADCMRRNICKLTARYPDGFDKARSINRGGKANGDE